MNVSEIAKLANVSKTAVSFALNGKPGISKATRAKILAIISEQGYSSSKLVKMAEQRTDAILLCMGSRTRITTFDPAIAPFFAEFVRVMEKKVNDAGYVLWLKTVVAPDDLSDEKVIQVMRNAAGTILIASDLLKEDVRQLMKHSDRLVVIDSLFPSLDVSCVVQDNYYGANQAAEHLISLGHTNIGYVGTEDRIYNCRQRRQGFEDALLEHDLRPNEKHTFFVNAVTTEATAMLEERLRAVNEWPTAYFTESDYLAIALIHCLQNKKVRVPEDVSVIGYDNIQMSAFMTPALTTVNMPKEPIAEAALSLLMGIIGSADSPRRSIRQIVVPELVLRSTCQRPVWPEEC